MSQTDEHFQVPLPKIAKGTHVLIVRAPYYKAIADDLLEGAQSALTAAGATFELLDVPGALEVPPAISMAANSDKFAGFVALGCVIRGETTHYETVCNDSSRGLSLLGLQGLCIGNGILTVENADQAKVRSDPKGQNKGGGAAEAALHLIAAKKRYGSCRYSPSDGRNSAAMPCMGHFAISARRF